MQPINITYNYNYNIIILLEIDLEFAWKNGNLVPLIIPTEKNKIKETQHRSVWFIKSRDDYVADKKLYEWKGNMLNTFSILQWKMLRTLFSEWRQLQSRGNSSAYIKSDWCCFHLTLLTVQ